MIWLENENTCLRIIIDNNDTIGFEIAKTHETFRHLIQSWQPYTPSTNTWNGAEGTLFRRYIVNDGQLYRSAGLDNYGLLRIDYYDVRDGWQRYRGNKTLFCATDFPIIPFSICYPKTLQQQEEEWQAFQHKLATIFKPLESPFTVEQQAYLKYQFAAEINEQNYPTAYAYYQACLAMKTSDRFTHLISTTSTSWAITPPMQTPFELQTLKDNKIAFFTALLDHQLETTLSLLNPPAIKPEQQQPLPLLDIKKPPHDHLLSAIQTATEQYLAWMTENTNGHRGLTRFRHFYHGSSGKMRAQAILQLINQNESLEAIEQAVINAFHASGTHQHSYSRYLIQAFCEQQVVDNGMSDQAFLTIKNSINLREKLRGSLQEPGHLLVP